MSGWNPQHIARLTRYRGVTIHATAHVLVPLLRCALVNRTVRAKPDAMKTSKIVEIGAGQDGLRAICKPYMPECEWISTEPSQHLIDAKVTPDPIIKCTAQELPEHFPANSIDAIVGLNVLDYMNRSTLMDSVDAIKTVLKPNGVLVHFVEGFWSGLSILPTLAAQQKDYIPLPFVNMDAAQLGVQLVQKDLVDYSKVATSGYPRDRWDQYLSSPVKQFQKLALDKSTEFIIIADALNASCAQLEPKQRRIVPFVGFFQSQIAKALAANRFCMVSSGNFSGMALVDARCQTRPPPEFDVKPQLSPWEPTVEGEPEHPDEKARQQIEVFNNHLGFCSQVSMSLADLAKTGLLGTELVTTAASLPEPPCLQRSTLHVTVATPAAQNRKMTAEMGQLMNCPVVPFIGIDDGTGDSDTPEDNPKDE
eukprot:TRINITY_DN67936_c2_g1_i2.p1 TRINITY_DN67936_c2_g1~~TRINITY_DN67936_c2_g1_i2.p1  ORF type:complete len:422 (+),score=21.60 TRINITY_DN67936_c2_g1_i2:31-1296(+)